MTPPPATTTAPKWMETVLRCSECGAVTEVVNDDLAPWPQHCGERMGVAYNG